MKKIIITGETANISAVALYVIVNQGSTIISTSDFYAPFSLSFDLSKGKEYRINIKGYTKEVFTFNIIGASSVMPVTPNC